MDINKDYYKTLGVSLHATADEIKTAYRKLAMKYHPDRNPGNQEYEELFKEINEAYEVLENSTDRFVYDQYRQEKADFEAAEKAKTANEHNQARHEPHTRKVKVKKTKTVERRVYIKGEIVIKFYGQHAEELTSNIFKEQHYRIYSTDAEITIFEQHLYPLNDAPEEHKIIYSEQELFKTAISQPIKCHVHGSGGTDFFYLNIKNIRIINPIIYDVTKNEGETYGTLKGIVFGYVQHFETVETEEEVTEFFGPTGNKDERKEEGTTYSRSEFYHSDGSTFWTPWEATANDYSVYPNDASTINSSSSSLSGCSPWIGGLILLFLLLIFAPNFILPLLLTGLIFLLFSIGGGIIEFLAPLLRILGWISLLIFLFSAFRSCFIHPTTAVTANTTRTTTVTTTQTPVPTRTQNNKAAASDSLISHYIQWNDFNNAHYAATLSILKSDLYNSAFAHENMNIPLNYEEDFSKVYAYLYQLDKDKLVYIYKALDSIKQERQLDDTSFANMMVTCIQNFPFTLVLDYSCNANYNDPYVSQYLANCTGDCCVGNEKYGVRSPIEFLSDLKGDCDTRSLLLFTLFKYFHYDVALLTSTKYKHAIIAVHFKAPYYNEEENFIINNEPYTLWETTNTGFRPGIVSYEISDLNYWDVSLLSNN